MHPFTGWWCGGLGRRFVVGFPLSEDAGACGAGDEGGEREGLARRGERDGGGRRRRGGGEGGEGREVERVESVGEAGAAPARARR